MIIQPHRICKNNNAQKITNTYKKNKKMLVPIMYRE